MPRIQSKVSAGEAGKEGPVVSNLREEGFANLPARRQGAIVK
jgi:hypothetical protein